MANQVIIDDVDSLAALARMESNRADRLADLLVSVLLTTGPMIVPRGKLAQGGSYYAVECPDGWYLEGKPSSSSSSTQTSSKDKAAEVMLLIQKLYQACDVSAVTEAQASKALSNITSIAIALMPIAENVGHVEFNKPKNNKPYYRRNERY